MAAYALRLRRSLPFTSTIINHHKHFSSVISSVAAPSSSCPYSAHQNPSLFDVSQSKPNSLSFQFVSSRSMSSRPRYNDNMDGDQISPDAILFEGCDYNHWLITIDFPKDPAPTPEEMVETYVQTAAKVLGSVEEAKKKIYACSTTTYQGFQVEVSEEVSEKFKGLPGVVFVLPDSYIDPVNKEYGGDKYINGTIIPRPPPVQFGRQGGRYNDRNRDYNRPPRSSMGQGPPPQQNFGDRMPMNNAPGGQSNFQGDRRGPMPSYQGNYNQGNRGNLNPPGQTDFPQRDQRNYAPSEQRDFRGPSPAGNYNQGVGGGYRQGTEGNYGQQTGGQFGQGGAGGHFGQGGAGGHFGQGGAASYGPPTGGQYGQGGAASYGPPTGGQYGQGGASYGPPTGGQYGQGVGGGYSQGTSGGYTQGPGGRFGQGETQKFGQGVGGAYGQGVGPGYSQNSTQYGENPSFQQVEQQKNMPGQQRNYEDMEEKLPNQGRY